MVIIADDVTIAGWKKDTEKILIQQAVYGCFMGYNCGTRSEKSKAVQ